MTKLGLYSGRTAEVLVVDHQYYEMEYSEQLGDPEVWPKVQERLVHYRLAFQNRWYKVHFYRDWAAGPVPGS